MADHTPSPVQIVPAGPDDAATLAHLVSESNKDVATLFKLDSDNCPKHPSFCQAAWIAADMSRGEQYFMAVSGGEPVACVATEYPSPEIAYLNRLAVLPGYRRQGIGAELTRFIVGLARERGAASVSIGVIGEHLHLQRWYQSLGFVPGELKRFAHLPFSVRYMACDVKAR